MLFCRILRFIFLAQTVLFLCAGNVLASAAILSVSTPEQVFVGEPFLCTLSSAQDPGPGIMEWLGAEVPASFERDDNGGFVSFILLGVPLESKAGVIGGRFESGQNSAEFKVKVIGKKFKEQHLTLPKKMVNPGKKSLDRHWKEKKKTTAAVKAISEGRFWRVPLVRPVPGKISSPFGLRRVLNGQPKSQHKGLDFRGKKGTPVKACSSGVVVLTGNHYFAGNSVYVDHGQGVISMYFHLSDIKVKEGEFVSAGQVVGLIGSTGRATGPHLHFGLSLQGNAVNPLPLF